MSAEPNSPMPAVHPEPTLVPVPTAIPTPAGALTPTDVTTPFLCLTWPNAPLAQSWVPDPSFNSPATGPAALFTGVRNLFDLAYPSCHDDQTLLGNRYLCRGGGLLFLGPTGIGKSAAVMQCSICWGVGRPAFGIAPSKPLKVLLVQAENDDGDLAEMRDGVLAGLDLDDHELELARQNLRVICEDAQSGIDFIQLIARALAVEAPDLLIIDPAFAYVGCSVVDQERVSAFLRRGLTPLIRKHGCGVIVIHHTNKPPTGKEKGTWQGGDFAYAGGGTAEWANWARAIILIRSLGLDDVFELRLAKRGPRVGWKEADGLTPRRTTLIGHSKVAGQIFWRELTAQEAEDEGILEPDVSKTPDVVMSLVPLEGAILKSDVINAAQLKGIGINKTKSLINALVGSGQLFPWNIPRPGMRPAVHLARQKQPVESNHEVCTVHTDGAK